MKVKFPFSTESLVFPKTSPHHLLFLLAVFMLSGCADFKLHYDRQVRDWARQEPSPQARITHSMYLIGDAGGAYPDSVPPAIELLGRKLKLADENSSVVFLGDNIYQDGLAPKSAKAERALDEHKLRVQLEILDDFQGKPFFIPGNHDWYTYGIKGLERQEDFIHDYLDRKDVYLPEPGCSGPEEIELGENLTLILFDSHWWLTDWEGHTEINDGCDAKSREVFMVKLEEALKGNRGKNVVVAMHHPLYTNGPHGGQYTVKDHIFPLTQISDNLYIPLPGLGTFFAFLRSTIGDPQDKPHPLQRALKTRLINAARLNGNFIFAAGHEHSLQYFENDEQAYIVSGSGSKTTGVKLGDGALFAYGEYGFARLDFYDDGSAWVQYWVPDEHLPEGRMVFRHMVKGPLEKKTDISPLEFPLYESEAKNIRVPLSRVDFKRTPTGEFLWGEHYRDTYAAEIEVPLLDLNKFKGGVVPVKKGGGYQTNSLRLEASNGQQYTMRSVDKDPSRTVPYPFNESFIREVVRDNFSAAHPLGALPIPALANAVGVYHTNPKLFYVPKQPGLESYNDDFGNALYLVEERPDDDVWEDQASFGKPEDILSTEDMLDEITDEHDHVVDFPMVARSRLFDILIGDWDRHDDQWRWAQQEKDDVKYYQPIPRDRDQAFSKYDGLIIGLARNAAAMAKQWRVYGPEVPKIQWTGYNARQFDPTFLSSLSWEDFRTEALHIKENLTDEIIESAFKEAWPEEVYQLDGPEIVASLKSRRDNMIEIARRFYEFYSREVDVIGTEERDLFLVERQENGDTRVRVYDTNKEGDREFLFYERTFNGEDTREIRMYGLDDEDIFLIRGRAKKGPLLRLIGGWEEDIFIDSSRVSGLRHKTLIYDSPNEDNEFYLEGEARKKLSADPRYNLYNRRSSDYEFDYGLFLPSLGFNPDDGFLLGGFGQITTYGFKKEPYATRHNFLLNYAFATSGVEFGYEGEFVGVLGNWDLLLGGLLRTPLYSINFYGFGNDTQNPEEEKGMNFNRVRQRLYEFRPSLRYPLGKVASVSFGFEFESYRIERTEDRFIDEIGPSLNPQVFEGIQYGGGQFRFQYRNMDAPAFPTHGIELDLSLGWRFNFNDSDRNFGYVKSRFTTFLSLTRDRKLVLGNRFGVHHNINRDFEFFQAATLGFGGPESNFRGFRRDRFSGKTAFFHNIDLRWRLLSSQNEAVPFSMGIYAGLDHGRVWLQPQASDTWHYSYGGGLFLSPFDIMSLHLSAFHGDGAMTRFMFGGSLFF